MAAFLNRPRTVVQSRRVKWGSPDVKLKGQTNSKALVLIICVGDYKEQHVEKDEHSKAFRDGVKQDLARYRRVFRDVYDFDVFPKEGSADDGKFWWLKDDIFEFVEKHCNVLMTGGYDSVIVVHRGHGSSGHVLSSAGEEVSIAELQQKISGRFATKTAKLLIIDACRGGDIVECEENKDEVERPSIGFQPEKKGSGLVTLYGNPDGCPTWESPENGGWLSQSVIYAFLRNAVIRGTVADIVNSAEKTLFVVGENTEVIQYVGDPELTRRGFITSSNMGFQEFKSLQTELVPDINEDQYDDFKVIQESAWLSKWNESSVGWTDGFNSKNCPTQKNGYATVLVRFLQDNPLKMDFSSVKDRQSTWSNTLYAPGPSKTTYYRKFSKVSGDGSVITAVSTEFGKRTHNFECISGQYEWLKNALLQMVVKST